MTVTIYKIQGLILCRSLLLFLLIPIIFSYDILAEDTKQIDLSIVYDLLAIGFVEIVFSCLWVIKGLAKNIILPIQVALNCIVVTGIVYISGSNYSPLIVLYLPLVMLIAIFFSRGLALFASMLCFVGYSFLVWGSTVNFLPDLNNLSLPTINIILQMLGLLSGMILVSIATSFLTSRISLHQLIADESSKELVEIGLWRDTFVESISHAVIIVDSTQIITKVNSTALKLFCCDIESTINQSITEFFEKLSPRNIEINAFIRSNASKREVEIFLHNDKRTILCDQKVIGSKERNNWNCVFLFEDVTHLRSMEERIAIQEQMAKLLSYDKSTENFKVPDRISDLMIGESHSVKEIVKLISRVANSDTTILILGESGTGKELVAKGIHRNSLRSNNPFVAVNCGAIPEALIESHLFGHVKGAFTGANQSHLGYFKEAEGGTLFLDEVAELPLSLQAKLLRVLQERKIRPVGSDRDYSIDVRILSATHAKLELSVKNGTFREDLYYRLNVVPIILPPLRERKSDITSLINYFLHEFSVDKNPPLIAPETLELLLKYYYPGNIRELRNIIERGCLLSDMVFLPEHLPETVRICNKVYNTTVNTEVLEIDTVSIPCSLDKILAEIEKAYVNEALLKSNGSRKTAAELLGINYRSFRYRLEKLGLDIH
jgi:transcriptional regulator with PAS, ATPase and Fis domain